MANSVNDIKYSANGKIYAGMTKESIRADVDAMNFKSEKKREKFYNKQIALFDYANNLVEGETDDIISEKEIEVYNKKEKKRKIWTTIGCIALGIGAAVLTSAILRRVYSTKMTAIKEIGSLSYIPPEAEMTQVPAGNVLPIEEAKSPMNLIDRYNLNGKSGKFTDSDYFFDLDNMRFTDEVNPQLLKKQSIPPNEKVIFISNFDDIKGTIAATTSLDKCIATDRMYQCAGLSVVDRSLNKQSLIHVYPGYSYEGNTSIIKKILEGSNPKNLEISIIPGCTYGTEYTTTFLKEVTNELVPEAKINFFNFPNISSYLPEFREPFHSIEECVHFIDGNAAVWLKDGKLFCCENNAIPNKIVNPREFLTYFGKIIHSKG